MQGRLGVIPAAAAAAIEAAAATLPFDPATLAAGVLKDGVPIVALVSQLRAALLARRARRSCTSVPRVRTSSTRRRC